MYVSYDASMNFTNVRWLYDKTNYGERVVNTLSGLDQGCLRLNRNVFSFVESIPWSSIFMLSHFETPPNYSLYNCLFISTICEWRMFLPLVYSWFEVALSLARSLCLPQSHLPFRLAFMWQLAHLSRYRELQLNQLKSHVWICCSLVYRWCRDYDWIINFSSATEVRLSRDWTITRSSAVEEKCPN